MPAHTASRLITLILLLQRQPNQKAADLAAELGVSVRTLHRYFSMLDEMGIPIYSERGPAGGFSLVRGYRMPPLVLTPEEAVAVYLGLNMVEEIWGQLYRQAAHGALAKLENVLPDEQRHEVTWAQHTLLATGMHRADQNALASTLDKLRRAARERRRLRLLYHSRSQPHPAERQIDPYALIHRWGWWYLIGYCHTRQEVRTFRVDRIVELSLLNESFSIAQEFDVHAYLAAEMDTQPTITVRLRFAPQLAQAARENALAWETTEAQPDGSVIVSLETPDLNWAVSTALSYGPGVTVLEPEAARRMALEWAQAIAAQYATPKEG